MFKIDELAKVTSGKLTNAVKQAGVSGICIDSRKILPGEAFIAIKGNNFDGHKFIKDAIDKGAGLVIHSSRSPLPKGLAASGVCGAVKVPFIAVEDTLKALGDIARMQRLKFNIPVIAVTGSNGKTTTKEMIAWVLSRKSKVLKNEGTKNNPIGLPMSLLDLDASYGSAVLEIGTNHFGEVEYLADICRPQVGVITNIGASHLEFFHDLKGVLKEKYSLLNNLENPRIAILNADDRLLRANSTGKTKKISVFGIGIKNKGDFFATDPSAKKGDLEFLVNARFRFTLKTFGYYNIYNALIAIACGRIFGLSYKNISEALAEFDFPKSRLKLTEFNKIRFIDDTYNSNPLSFKHALEVLGNFKTKGRKILVMGDMLELGPEAEVFHRRAGKKIAKACDLLITVGKLSRFAAKEAESAGFDTRGIFSCESSLEARDILFNKLSPCENDIILVKGSRSMKMEEVFKT